MSAPSYDVAIVGAGPAGLALACVLGRAGVKVAVLDRSTTAGLSDPVYDGREIALTHRSWRILNDLGAARYIDDTQRGQLRRAVVLNGGSPHGLTFDPGSTAQDSLGFIVSNHVIRAALYKAAADCPHITPRADFSVAGVRHDDNGVVITAADGRECRAAGMVVADGRFSKIRDGLGIAVDRRDYGRMCIVTRLRHSGNLRETAYEIFGHDHTMALLPLTRHECSLVLTVPPERARVLMDMDNDNFMRALSAGDIRRYPAILRRRVGGDRPFCLPPDWGLCRPVLR